MEKGSTYPNSKHHWNFYFL